MGDEVDALRREQTRLRNEAVEAEARPGHPIVVIRKETLAYYQQLERMLGQALELAERQQPAVVELTEAQIQEAVKRALSELAGVGSVSGLLVIDDPVQLNGTGVAPAAFIQRAKALEAAGDAPGDVWLTMEELQVRHQFEIDVEAAWGAVYAKKIRREGRGSRSRLHAGDFEAWLKKFKPRRKKGK